MNIYIILPIYYSVQYRSETISLIFLNYNLDLAILTDMSRVRAAGVTALHDTVLDIGVVTDMHVVQNDRVLDRTIVPNINLFKQHRILHHTVDDTAA